ncbi:MAG: polysaccharide biosynthesis/export family protein [Gemmatimonadota bacterium]
MKRSLLLPGTLSLLLVAPPVSAQVTGHQRFQSRAEVIAERDSLRRAVSTATDEEALIVIQDRLARVENRLQVGDFLPGDVLSLIVTGQTQWTGNFTIQTDQTLLLPDVDPIPLAGVLYSEAEAVIADHLTSILREPEVRLTPLLRVLVAGEVGNPGFYDLDGSTLLSDAIQAAGGPTSSAKLGEVELRREGHTYRAAENLVFRGLTLTQLGVMAGDEIFVPAQGGGFLGGFRNVALIIGTLASFTFLIIRIQRI